MDSVDIATRVAMVSSHCHKGGHSEDSHVDSVDIATRVAMVRSHMN